MSAQTYAPAAWVERSGYTSEECAVWLAARDAGLDPVACDAALEAWLREKFEATTHRAGTWEQHLARWCQRRMAEPSAARARLLGEEGTR